MKLSTKDYTYVYVYGLGFFFQNPPVEQYQKKVLLRRKRYGQYDGAKHGKWKSHPEYFACMRTSSTMPVLVLRFTTRVSFIIFFSFTIPN